MIGHQAPREDTAVRGESFLDLFQEEQVVFSIEEDALLIVTPVVNVIEITRNEAHGDCLLAGWVVVRRLFLIVDSRRTTGGRKSACLLP